MSCLITGATGFAGKALTKELSGQGIKWSAFEGDVTDGAAFDCLGDYEVVAHLAAVTPQRNKGRNNREMMRINIIGTLNALRFAAKQTCRFIYASTYLYEYPCPLPTPETTPVKSHDDYSFSKWYGEQSVNAFHAAEKIDAVIFRMFNIYGPGQPPGFLIPDIIAMAEKGKLELRETGSRRDFLYIDDYVALIVKAIQRPVDGLQIVNAGSGENKSVHEVATAVLRTMNLDLPIHDQKGPVKIPETKADIKRGFSLYGWTPHTPFSEGIKKTVAQYQKV